MSDVNHLAGEYALGLLEGEALLAARARLARDPAFAEAVAAWEARLAPLLDEVPGATPSPDLWQRITAELDQAPPEGEVVTLQRRVRFWRRVSVATATAATALVAVVVLRPLPERPQPSLPAPMVASIPIAQTDLRLTVTYLPERREMLVSAAGLKPDGVHDHELWLVRKQGDPVSLGVISSGFDRRVHLQADIAAQLAPGARMVLTREPLGGKPPNKAAGPVVAEGSLSTI